MLKALTYVLIPFISIMQDVILCILVAYGLLTQRRRRLFEPKCYVAMSPLFFVIATFCSAILSLPVTLFGPEDLDVGIWWIFEGCILAGIIILLAYCNETIIYDSCKFEVSNISYFAT